MIIEPGCVLPYDEEEWRDALVAVERGDVELEARCGRRFVFRCGSLMWLEGQSVVSLRNPGGEPVRLVTTARDG